MNIRLRLSALVLTCMPVLVLAEKPEELLENTRKLFKETTAALVGVKDAAGAKAVLSKLDGLAERMKKVDKEMLRLRKAKSDKSDEELLKWRSLDPVRKALEKELMRLDTYPPTHKVLRDQTVVRMFRKAQETRALIDVQGLSVVCETFKLNNGNYPDKIEELGMPQPGGGGALAPENRLRDPWGRYYRIDGDGTRNKGKRCDVWSIGHPILNRKIGNWMTAPPASDPPKGRKDEKKEKETGKDRAKKTS